MRTLGMFFALVALACMAAFGAAVDGKWTVETQGRNGTQTLTLTLQSDGSNLTGSLVGGRGGSVEITEGKMDGANVTFKVVRAGRNGGTQTVTYSGTLSGDDLKLATLTESVAADWGNGISRGGARGVGF